MLWVGPDEKIVYILTDKNKLYRSADEGKTWVDQMPRMKRSDSVMKLVTDIFLCSPFYASDCYAIIGTVYFISEIAGIEIADTLRPCAVQLVVLF